MSIDRIRNKVAMVPSPNSGLAREQELKMDVYNSPFVNSILGKSFMIGLKGEETVVYLQDLLSLEVPFEQALNRFLNKHAGKGKKRKMTVEILSNLEKMGILVHYVTKRIQSIDFAILNGVTTSDDYMYSNLQKEM